MIDLNYFDEVERIVDREDSQNSTPSLVLYVIVHV